MLDFLQVGTEFAFGGDVIVATQKLAGVADAFFLIAVFADGCHRSSVIGRQHTGFWKLLQILRRHCWAGTMAA